jgi:hypothetical protein
MHKTFNSIQASQEDDQVKFATADMMLDYDYNERPPDFNLDFIPLQVRPQART